MNAVVNTDPAPIIKLDIGCGPNKKSDWTGVDRIAFPNVDVVCDVGTQTWPWPDDSVDEAHASHFLEHLTNFNGKWERVHFFNELFRVMKPMGQCLLIFPHWSSNRYYGDPTHCEPFSEMGFYYLDRAWRKANAPHTDIEHNPRGYSCNWNCTWAYTMRQDLTLRNTDYQQYAMQNYKEVILDMMATMTATK
jgi:hypothetical protein